MTATLERIHRQRRNKARVALLMARDALEAAQGRIAALTVAVGRGVYNDAMHTSAMAEIDRAVRELNRAEVNARYMDDEGDDHAA